MDVKVTQCPSCGSPVEAPKTGMLLECHYCGSTLHIVRSASGAPLAELADIKVDTALLAREQARARLRERIERLEAEIQPLASMTRDARREHTEHVYSLGCIGGLFGGVAAGLLLDSVTGEPALGAILGLAVWLAAIVFASRFADRAPPAVEAEEKRLESLRAERDALTRRLCEIEQELDELTERL